MIRSISRMALTALLASIIATTAFVWTISPAHASDSNATISMEAAPEPAANHISAQITESTGATPPEAVPLTWKFYGYVDTEYTCNWARNIYLANGYPTQPTAGCYRTQWGYYFYYWDAETDDFHQ